MIRQILAVVCGIFAAVAVVSFWEMIGTNFYPAPANFNPNNKDEIIKFMNTLPMGAFVWVLSGIAFGSFISAFTAGLINMKKSKLNSILMGILMTLFSIANLVMIPHPIWFMVVNMLICIPFAYLAFLIIKMIFTKQFPVIKS